MQHLMTRALLLAVLVAVPNLATAEEAMGRLSLVTNPRVMVYIDGARVGMSPLINHSIGSGEHRMALLLILPNGNRLRADYNLVVAAGGETTASIDLVRNAPAEGEVRTIGATGAAAPAANPPAANPPAANPPAANPPAANPPAANPPAANPPAANPPASGGWATNPGHPSNAPVSVAAPPTNPPPPPEPEPEPEPQVQYGLSRDMVREGLEALRPVVQRCMEGRSGVIQIRLVIQPDGGVAEVAAQGIWRGTNTGDCIEQAIPEEAAFPIYEGDPIPVVYPYRFAPQ